MRQTSRDKYDFFATNSTAIVKRAEKCWNWNSNKSIFAEWMKVSYVKRMHIDGISERTSLDSHMSHVEDNPG